MPDNRLTELRDAIRGKNVLEAPQVERIDPEIRTAMKFFGVKKENFGEAVDTRGGVVPGVILMWHYAVLDREAFLDLLRTVEPDLAQTSLTGATYLGTYMRFISEIEPSNQFMTQWGCRSLANIAEIGNYEDGSPLAIAFKRLIDLIDPEHFRQSIHSLAVLARD